MLTPETPRLALTLIQPWATLIIHFGKDVENRDWKPTEKRVPPGTRFFVHAGAKLDRDAYRWAREHVPGFDAFAIEHVERWCVENGMPSQWTHGAWMPTRAVLGTVRYDGLADDSSMWRSDSRFGFKLAEPIALREPVTCTGALQFWNMNDNMRARCGAMHP